jgi:hypothetical protein
MDLAGIQFGPGFPGPQNKGLVPGPHPYYYFLARLVHSGTLETGIHFGGSAPIDLLFVDADHSFVATALSLGACGLLLRPRLVVLDDVAFNDGMQALWSRLRTSYDAVNCSDIVPAIRIKECGLGLLRLR